MIKGIQIQNLRSIKDSGMLKLKPITILLGANSSGKSTFLRSFPLFKQSVDKHLRGPVSWFDNAYVDFGDFDTAKNKYAPKDEGITFIYRISELTEKRDRHFIFSYNNTYYYRVDSNEFKDSCVSFTLKGDSKGTYINCIDINLLDVQYRLTVDDRKDAVHFNINGTDIDLPDKLYFDFNTSFSILPSIVKKSSNDEFATSTNIFVDRFFQIIKSHCDRRLQNYHRLDVFLNYANLNSSDFLTVLKKGSGIKSFQKSIRSWNVNTQEFKKLYTLFLLVKLNEIIRKINNELASFYRGCEYIAPMRAEANRYYRIQGLQVNTVDASGTNLLEFIASLPPKRKSDFDDFVSKILDATVDVCSEAGMKSLHVKKGDADFSIADVGYGYSQILPVITKLWQSVYESNLYGSMMDIPDNKIIVMEQPELHLHPAMQAKMADVLIKTITEIPTEISTQTLIVETHSQALINRIGRRIREGKISSNDVNVILFQKDVQYHNSIIKQISFTDKGQLQDWPYGFFDPID